MSEDSSERSTRIVTRRFDSLEEADRHDLKYWLTIPERERVMQTSSGRDAFIRNKRATGRAKDLGDVEGM